MRDITIHDKKRFHKFIWMNGLGIRIANSLFWSGFSSKKELLLFLDEGRDLCEIEGIGKASKSKILEWLK